MREATLDQRTSNALGWAFFGVTYLACFFLSTALPTPVLWYLPTEHRFHFGVRSEGIAADFYGRVALALAIGWVGGLLGRAFVQRVTPAARARWIWRAISWLAGLLIFTAALYVYLLIGRHSPPAPLPALYVPR